MKCGPLETFENKIFSQNGEDGITLKLIELLYENDTKETKFYVEFGVEDGNECNTRILRDHIDWNGLLMDANHENHFIHLKKEFITKNNIIDLFQKYNVPLHIHLLSIDIDFNDFYVLKEILKHYVCDIIICEYNASHAPNEDKIVIYDENGRWDETNYYGVSLLSLCKLCKDYTLIYCETKGVNSFFIRSELLVQKQLEFLHQGNIEKIYRLPKYSHGPNGGHPQDPHQRKFVSYEDVM